MSFEARGVLCYLLSKPNNWSVNVDDLARAGSIGRDKAYRILNELIDARYIDREIQRNADGRVRQVEYVVYNEPIGKGRPLPEKPETAKPETVQPETENTDEYIRTHSQQELKETNTHLVERAVDLVPIRNKEEAFEAWWSGYPEKVGKGAARKAFDQALRKASIEVLICGVERYIATKPADRAWCHPSTWLNQERWLDQPTERSGKRPQSLAEFAQQQLSAMHGGHGV
ncbi:Uncharacterized protein MLTONO_0387 [Mesorhizobium loti]|nr:Uncharacterized protein MLTONO_0387 [Mesorhizobium loti]